MKLLANIMVGFVALSHIGIMVLEMFFWDSEFAEKAFDIPRAQLQDSVVLAANQGLYNGFLAAGLIWALLSGKRDVQLFFLGCVVVAGVFGAFTAKFSILFTQGAPALLAFVFVLLVIRMSGRHGQP